MNDALLLVAALVGVGLIIYSRWPEPPFHTFTVPLSKGTLTTRLVSSDDPVAIERKLRRWAIRLKDPQEPLDDAVEHALGVRVVSVSLDLPEAQEESKKPTLQDELIETFDAKYAAAQALAEKYNQAVQLEPISIRGRSLDIKFADWIAGTIGDLFDHPYKAKRFK